jgi:hypothetical protein
MLPAQPERSNERVIISKRNSGIVFVSLFAATVMRPYMRLELQRVAYIVCILHICRMVTSEKAASYMRSARMPFFTTVKVYNRSGERGREGTAVAYHRCRLTKRITLVWFPLNYVDIPHVLCKTYIITCIVGITGGDRGVIRNGNGGQSMP